MNWRRTMVGAAAGLVATAGLAQMLAGQAVKGFRLPEYDRDGQLKQQLYGETATFLPDGIIELTGLKIEIFNEGRVTARVYSPQCIYDPNRKLAASKDAHIRIIVEKGVVTGDGFAWNGTNEQFQIFKNVRVTMDGKSDESLLAPRPAAGREAEPGPAATPATEGR